MQESDFLKQITTVEELEPKASNCTKVPGHLPGAAEPSELAERRLNYLLLPQVLVWHTRTEKVNLANEPKYHLDTVNIEV